MTIADQVTGSTIAGTAGAKPAEAKPVAAKLRAPAITLPAIGERELRLDLFRGLALWLIFIDHLPPNLLTWFTIRNYGFSDATEIFIFISGYTAAFVYGRAMLESGFVIATARILRRVWQIYVAHVFLFTIFLAEISYVATSFENPLYTEEMGIMDFLKQPDVTIVQALLLRFRPVNMDVLPLYIVLMLALPLILWSMKWRPDVTLALSAVLYAVTWEFDLYLLGLSERLLGVQSARLAIAVRVRGMVRARRCATHVAHSGVTRDDVDLDRLSRRGVLRDADLVRAAARPSHAEAARAVDVSDRQDRPRRAALHAFPGAGRAHRALPAAGVAGPEIALAAAADPVRLSIPSRSSASASSSPLPAISSWPRSPAARPCMR